MGSQFEPSGVELIAKNLGQFLADLNKANQAIADVGTKGASAAGAGIAPFKGLGDSILDVGAKAATVAATGLAALGAGIAAVAVKGTMMALDLEQGLANIAAKSGRTVAEITPLKNLISELALDPNLKVTTDEATAAIEALTKQGMEMTTIVEGAGKATVALSNATGGDFGTSASLTAGIMKAFNVEAKDLTQVIDGITGVTTNSKFTVDDYALAFAQAGAVAANLGVDLQDFNAVIGATASSFSSGSDAGTSFKTLLLRLSAPTAEMKATMQEYGISLFDAEGKMRSMSDIVNQLNTVLQGNVTVTSTVGGATKELQNQAKAAAESLPDLTHQLEQQSAKLEIMRGELALTAQYYGEGSPKTRKMALEVQDLEYEIAQNTQTLNEYNAVIAEVSGAQARQVTSTKQLTEAERAKVAEALGGADASRLILALSKTSQEEFDKLSGKINSSGLAFDAASTRMDTAKGALEILQGVIEAINIQIGEKFVPLVKAMSKAMTTWVSKNSGKFVAFFGTIATGIETFIGKISSLATVFQAGGLFGSRAGSFGSQGLLGALGLSPEAIVTVQNFFAQVGSIVSSFMSGGLFGAEGESGGLLTSLGLSPESVTLVTGAIESVKATLLSLAPQFAEVSSVADVVSASILFIRDNFTTLAGAIGGIVAAGTIGVVIASIAAIANPVTGLIVVAGLLGAAWASNWGDIQGKTAAVWATIQPVLSTMITWLSTNIPIAITAVSGFWTTTLLPALTVVGTWITGTLVPILSDVWTWLSNNIPVAIQTLSTFWSTILWPAIATVSDYLLNTVVPMLSNLANVVFAELTGRMEVVSESWDIMLPYVLAIGDYIGTTIVPLFLAVGNLLGVVVYKSMQAFIGLWKNVLWPAIKDVGTYLTATLSPAFDAMAGIMVNNVNPPLDNFTNDILPALEAGMDGIRQVIIDVTGYFKALADAVMAFEVPPILQSHSPTPFEVALLGISSAAQEAGASISEMAISPEAINSLLGLNTAIASTEAITAIATRKLNRFYEANNLETGKRDLATRQIAAVFTANRDAILNAQNPVEEFKRLAQAAGILGEGAGFSGAIGELANKGFAAFLEAYGDATDLLTQAQREAIEAAGRSAVDIGSKLNDMVQENAKILSDSIDLRVASLEDLIAAAQDYNQTQITYEGNILTVAQAQDELNAALQEQQDLQNQLLETQQNQQKLDYLERQLDLLETIRQAGLDPQDILGGLSLGLDASIPDMIEATNRLVAAMVAQIDSELQIASPSKVLMKRGSYAGLGLAEGLLNTIPRVKDSMQRMLSPLTMQPQSVVTNNYDFNMQVNTGSSASSVISQYNVMRALAV